MYVPLLVQGQAAPEPEPEPSPASAASFSRCAKFDEKIQYIRPDGVKVWLHSPPATVVMAEEGFGMPPLNYISDRAPFQHGETFRDFFAGIRPMQLTVLQNFYSRAGYWNGRASLVDAIRPSRIADFSNLGKILYFLGNGQKRQIDVVVESGPGFAPKQQGWRSWSYVEVLRFLAPDPAWYDPTLQTTTFVQSVGELVFPATFPIIFGGFGTTTDVVYDGTWLEYPTIVITGPISGPRIANLSTGKVLALDYNLLSGMSITITLRGRKTVQSSGLNLLNYLTSDSDLTEFSLVPDPLAPGGVNQIQVSGSDTNLDTSVALQWYKRYIGI